MHQIKRIIRGKIFIVSIMMQLALIGLPMSALAMPALPLSNVAATNAKGQFVCGDKSQEVVTAIDIGCKGKGNPITDTMFAIIRFLSAGVGLVIIGSIIVGGVQYSASRGDPQATANAVKRIQNTMIALVIFIFGYAILNYVIPAGFLK